MLFGRVWFGYPNAVVRISTIYTELVTQTGPSAFFLLLVSYTAAAVNIAAFRVTI